MQDCFRQKVTKDVGYEAQLAHVSYSLRSIEEMAVHLRISGFSDKLFEFAQSYIDILIECAKDNGFKSRDVRQSIAKIK